MNGWTGVDANSRKIAARVSQTFGDPLLNGVASYHDDRNTRRQLFEDACARANDEDDIRVAPNDFRRQRFGAGCILLSAVTFDLEVFVPRSAPTAEARRIRLEKICFRYAHASPRLALTG